MLSPLSRWRADLMVAYAKSQSAIQFIAEVPGTAMALKPIHSMRSRMMDGADVADSIPRR